MPKMPETKAVLVDVPASADHPGYLIRLAGDRRAHPVAACAVACMLAASPPGTPSRRFVPRPIPLDTPRRPAHLVCEWQRVSRSGWGLARLSTRWRWLGANGGRL